MNSIRNISLTEIEVHLQSLEGIRTGDFQVLVRSTLPLERLHDAHSILSVGSSTFFFRVPFPLLETELT